ncbi:hypothetical protein KUA07_08880 [Proteus mirabilis]|uniref:hypothetical protein n=1 Tax=Proteus mirabilis TaxID=584 RepID=UPI001BAFD1D5|nr:hypothetical protein [Proteus mirabilis]MBS3875882.1 hypothetical protein [Proteus mirabilis]MCT0236397.1 hypothetical protein [Proteus mirabilis]
MNNEYNREQMKLGVLYARNHLISAYRANFIECDECQFAMFMNTLSLVANESIDIELMMENALSCNDEAENWIKEILIKYSKLNNMQIIGYVLLMLIQGSAVPVTEDIYTQSECNKRAEYLMSVKNVNIVCGEVLR